MGAILVGLDEIEAIVRHALEAVRIIRPQVSALEARIPPTAESGSKTALSQRKCLRIPPTQLGDFSDPTYKGIAINILRAGVRRCNRTAQLKAPARRVFAGRSCRSDMKHPPTGSRWICSDPTYKQAAPGNVHALAN